MVSKLKRIRSKRVTQTAENVFDGEAMHAMHKAKLMATDDAREILASILEPQFPVEAQRARKGLHFMLPASWAVEAIQKALDAK